MMRKNFYFSLLISLLQIGFGNALLHSQENQLTALSSADSVLYTVTASPVTIHANQLAVPYAISAVEQQKIELNADPSIEPLLNATPGLWMQSGALNTNRISIRGVGYREPFATTGIKCYLDEIPLTNGVGESAIEDIPPVILSGIDIWRGPASALWGSGLGGMIHLKSHMPDEGQWQSGVQIGPFNRVQVDQHVSVRYGEKDQWGSVLQYQYLNDGGYRDNNHYRKNSLTWMQQWRGTRGLTINALVLAIGLKAFIPSSLNLNDYENNPATAAPAWSAVMGNEDYTKWITGLNVSYAPAAGWVYKGSVFGHFFNGDEVRPFNVLRQHNSATGMRHRFTLQIKNAGNITMGLEYFNEHYALSTYETLDGGTSGQQLTDEHGSRSYINGFAQTEWALKKKWFLFAGLNAALSRLSNNELHASTPIDVFPTAGLTYSIHTRWALSFSVSRGYSSLSLDDMLNADGLVNPDIIPESGWSEEVSLKYAMPGGSFAKLTFFNMNIKNTILTRRLMDDVFEKLNGGSSIHQGIELEYKWLPATEKISLEGAYTYGLYRFDKFIEAGISNNGNRLPGTPLHHVFTRLTFSPWLKWRMNVDYHYVSDVFLDDANTVKGKGYQLVNAGLSYEVIAGEKWSGSLSATVHNLIDVEYSPMFQINAPGSQPRYYYPGKPRSFYLSCVFTHRI